MHKLVINNEKIAEIESKIGYTFKNKQLLSTAFVHSSYAKKKAIDDNERLEFFGDALLEAIVTEYLFANHPNKDVGQLSKARAAIVSSDGLQSITDRMGIAGYLLMTGGGNGARTSSVKTRANLFEALLCAVYLDGGMEVLRQFVLRWLGPLLAKVDFDTVADSKTYLQEYCQANKIALRYVEVLKSGPDNKPVFRYEVLLDDLAIADGEGRNIKLAQMQAAQNAINKLKLNG